MEVEDSSIKKVTIVFSGPGCGVLRKQVFPGECSHRPRSRGKRAKRIFLTEDEVEDKYSDTYDQPKESDDGYIDEDESPHRYLKGWYLCHQNAPEKRVPLPQKTQFFSNKTVLRGWLQPPEGASVRIKPVMIEVQDLYFYSMDRSPEYRGYWIQSTNSSTSSTNALYWLQEPEALSGDTINAMAQEEVHFPARITLAIVSAMCERVFCGRQCNSNINKTADEVLRAFPLLKTKNVSPDELFLFERRVLAKYQHAVHMHLSGYIPDKLEPKNSTFLRSLIRLQPENHKLAATELERWAGAIERQCKQNSWGGPCDSVADSATKSKSMKFHLEKDRLVAEKVIQTTTEPVFARSSSAVLLMKDNSNLDTAEEVVAASKDSTEQQEPGNKRVQEENITSSNKRSCKDSKIGGTDGISGNDEWESPIKNFEGTTGTKFLSSKPGVSHFNLVVDEMQNGYCISAHKDQANEFFVKLADFELDTMPLEWAFLAVASLDHSFSMNHPSKEYVDNLRGLFKVKRKDGRWLAQIVFHDFRNHCLHILRQPDSIQREREGITAMHLLKSITSLIPSCCLIIKHRGHYEKILERGINWELTIAEIRNFTSEASCLGADDRDDLLSCLNRAEQKIHVIKNTEKSRQKVNALGSKTEVSEKPKPN